jgi:hypothetical protein
MRLRYRISESELFVRLKEQYFNPRLGDSLTVILRPFCVGDLRAMGWDKSNMAKDRLSWWARWKRERKLWLCRQLPKQDADKHSGKGNNGNHGPRFSLGVLVKAKEGKCRSSFLFKNNEK